MGLHPTPAGNLRSFMEALAEQLVQQLVQGCRGLAEEAAAASGAGGGGGGTGARRGRDRRGAEGAAAAGLQGAGASVEQLVQLVGDLAFLERVLQPLLGGQLQADMQEAQVCVGCGAMGSWAMQAGDACAWLTARKVPELQHVGSRHVLRRAARM